MWHIILMFILFLPTVFYMSKKLSSRDYWKYYSSFGFYYFVSSVLAAVVWPFFLLRPKDVRNANILVGYVAAFYNKVLEIKWVLRNKEILAEERAAVIVSNHQSALDILGMGTIWDDVGRIVTIAKKPLLYVFPFGLVAYLAGTVFIDRNNPKTAYDQLKVTSDIMIRQKIKMWLFPEGTRNKDYTKLLPFKKGAFNIAVAAQVPIIPVVFSPYYFINTQKCIFRKGHIIIQALEPIPTVGLTAEDVPELTANVYEKMSAAYKELSKEVLIELPVHYPYTNIG